jgi:hypothetical protein
LKSVFFSVWVLRIKGIGCDEFFERIDSRVSQGICMARLVVVGTGFLYYGF